jgi:hypothetical protein
MAGVVERIARERNSRHDDFSRTVLLYSIGAIAGAGSFYGRARMGRKRRLSRRPFGSMMTLIDTPFACTVRRKSGGSEMDRAGDLIGRLRCNDHFNCLAGLYDRRTSLLAEHTPRPGSSPCISDSKGELFVAAIAVDLDV